MTELDKHIQELFAAIQNADVDQVKRLLASGVTLDQKNANGQTPLTLASSMSHAEIIQLLISAGAQVNLASEPLVFNPQITGTDLPGGRNLSDLIAQATAEAPEEVKNFYAGFMSVVDALSGQSSQSPIDAMNDADRVIDADDSDDDQENYDEDEEASTPLGAAVLKGDANTVRTLLQAGANPNPSAWYEPPVLVIAARKGDVEIVQALIAAGANVNRGFDELPLHTAAEEGHLEVVRLLLEAGADVEGYEEDEWTALMAASFAGYLAIAQLLVERGADVNAWSQGETPLMLAARGAHREVYQFLYPLVSDEIRAIGDRDAENEMAKTLKHRSRKQNKSVEKLIDAAMYGDLKKVQQLIADGVDVNAIASCNRTALSLAIQGGHIPVIQALLDAGADPNLPDETDDGLVANTPLMEAASTFFAPNRSDMVRLLIQKGANVNQQGAQGQTALMSALAHSDMDVIETLIKAGANLDIRDSNGNTALMQAESGRLTKVASVLRQAGASQQGLKEVELFKAVRQGDVEKVKALLQDGVDINLRVGGTALCQAAQKGNLEIVKLLIAAGADVDQRASEGYFNPLLYAAYDGNLEVVRALLEAGADVHVRVKDYLNPLEYAELGQWEGNRKGQPFDEVIALLKSYGATKSASLTQDNELS
ncbi:MAG: ankyrin repeat domain-containing protein [Oculatellaceae cyanobacterium bins.114]|nr:ankyrin repeat domain-containing protein [Oculatellaceae cyanobacterium bins.114]